MSRSASVCLADVYVFVWTSPVTGERRVFRPAEVSLVMRSPRLGWRRRARRWLRYWRRWVRGWARPEPSG